MLAPTVGHYQFVRDDGQPLDFQPGQFIQVHFSYADGTETKRSYSLATIHDHALGPGEAVDIAVSFVPGGAATALFEALEQGGQISASGPYGRFCLNPGDHNARYLLIATGTGVTPYRSMLPLLEKAMAERGVQIVLLQGARSPGELLYSEDFYSFAESTRTSVMFRACRVNSRLIRTRTYSTATCSRRWPASRRTRPPTSPTCAATRTWSMPVPSC